MQQTVVLAVLLGSLSLAGCGGNSQLPSTDRETEAATSRHFLYVCGRAPAGIPAIEALQLDSRGTLASVETYPLEQGRCFFSDPSEEFLFFSGHSGLTTLRIDPQTGKLSKTSTSGDLEPTQGLVFVSPTMAYGVAGYWGRTASFDRASGAWQTLQPVIVDSADNEIFPARQGIFYQSWDGFSPGCSSSSIAAATIALNGSLRTTWFITGYHCAEGDSPLPLQVEWHGAAYDASGQYLIAPYAVEGRIRPGVLRRDAETGELTPLTSRTDLTMNEIGRSVTHPAGFVYTGGVERNTITVSGSARTIP